MSKLFLIQRTSFNIIIVLCYFTLLTFYGLCNKLHKVSFDGFHGGRSSVVELQIVDLAVVGSNPIDHPSFVCACSSAG